MDNVFKILRSLRVLFFEILKFLRKLFEKTTKRILEKYLAAGLPVKIIFLNIILAFFAIILPVAKFKIFGNYTVVNNPLAVYMMGIVVLMFAVTYFNKLVQLLARSLTNAYYLFWIIYLPLAGELTKANPYSISVGYYFNIATPVIFIVAAVLDYFFGDN